LQPGDMLACACCPDAKRAQQAGQLALRQLTRRAIILRAAPFIPQAIAQPDQRLDQSQACDAIASSRLENDGVFVRAVGAHGVWCQRAQQNTGLRSLRASGPSRRTRVDPLAEVWESDIIPTDPLAGRSPVFALPRLAS
jgi:hypothetical protein